MRHAGPCGSCGGKGAFEYPILGKSIQCPVCLGRGVAPDTRPERCRECEGWSDARGCCRLERER